MTATNELRPNQLQAVPILAAGRSQAEAAEAAGVAETRTIRRWLDEPEFVAEVNRARDTLFRETLGLLAAEAVASVRVLADLRDSAESEQVRRGAARDILSLSLDLRSDVDLAERVARLEQHLLEEETP